MKSKLTSLAQAVGAHLLAGQKKLATAESCTGGYIAEVVTRVPGCSEWFDCGFVTYSNSAKQRMLGVSEATLAEYGAVSEAVVVAMAKGALAHSNADIAVAVSGIAGPDGGTEEKPVGLVWLAFATTDGACETQQCFYRGDRAAVREQVVEEVLLTIQKWPNLG